MNEIPGSIDFDIERQGEAHARVDSNKALS